MIIISHSMGFLVGSPITFCLWKADVVEHGPAEEVLNSPKDERTKDF